MASGALRVGDRIDVIGAVASAPDGADAYRGAPRVITGGGHPLYLIADGSRVGRRLAIAAAVEIACAAGLSACALGFVVAWFVLRRVALAG
jgi:hypothetical protein